MKASFGNGHKGPRGQQTTKAAFFAALDDASSVRPASDIVFDRVPTNFGGAFEEATV